jgi:Ca-activated chloride channel family protein
LARDLGVTVHTIAIGPVGRVVQGVDHKTDLPFMVEIAGPNLPLLERLAQLSGGVAFAATDVDGLAEVFRKIDELEKSPIRGRTLTRYEEHYAVWVARALGLLILEMLLVQGRLRRLP